jgi:hypothetical protein
MNTVVVDDGDTFRILVVGCFGMSFKITVVAALDFFLVLLLE